MGDAKKDPYASIHYRNYLRLDDILGAQELRSVALDKPAHDEMLFIIIHQVYELWFKQILHEVDSVMTMFKGDYVDERSISTAVARFDRVVSILEVCIQQIIVLETLKPLDFLDFRNYLFPASGFQSFQFRKLEVSLGLKSDRRITYNNKPYHQFFTEEQTSELELIEATGSLMDEVGKWLERTPFLKFDSFTFLAAYRKAVDHMVERESANISENKFLSEEEKQMRLKMMGDTSTFFEGIFDEDKHNELISKGELRLSYKATLAALFIKLYRDQPILAMPNAFLERLLDIEELLTAWRFRHSQMVLRMLGRKVGTGGSSGHDYLFATVIKHRIFTDLYNLSTMMIPRSDLPELPDYLAHNLDFNYKSK